METLCDTIDSIEGGPDDSSITVISRKMIINMLTPKEKLEGFLINEVE